MTDINQHKTAVSQVHKGTGDNILVVESHGAITPSTLSNSLNDILLDVLHRKHRAVIEKVEILEKSGNLDPQSTNFLTVIKLLVDFVDGKIADDASRQLDSIVHSNPAPDLLDITQAAKIILFCKKEDQSSAKALFESIQSPGLYSRSAFYEYLPDHAELSSIYENYSHSLVEVELCAIVRGFLRANNFALAADISDLLVKRYPSVNSRFLEALSKVNNLLQGRYIHFWIISATQKKQLFEWADKLSELLDESEGLDSRIVELAGHVCHFCYGEHQGLLESCWKYISVFDKHAPNAAKSIRSVFEANPSYGDGLISEMAKAQSDKAYRKEVIDNLKKSKELSAEDVIILSRYGDTESIQSWIDEGGNVASDDDFEKDYSMLELVCFSYEKSPEVDARILKQGKAFLSKHQEKLKEINPIRLIELANKLIDANQTHLASQLLKPHIPEADIWPSELVRCYLNSLLGSGQYKTLDDVIEQISFHERDSFVWQVIARKLEYQGDIPGAIDALKNSLETFPDSLNIYYYLLYLYFHHEYSEDELKDFLSSIPENILEEESSQALKMLLAIAKHHDFTLAERIILSWFIANPIRSAVSITDFYGGLLFNKIDRPTLSLSSGGCIGAYQYTRNKQHVTQLIVEPHLETEHNSLLKGDTPLAEILIAGEDQMLGTNSIENIKQVSPLIAAFTIAAEIRQANNHGFDPFMQLGGPNTTVEENVDQLIKVLQSQDNREEQVSDPKIPLYMKGHLIGNGCPVQRAYGHLTSKVSHKEPLPSFGADKPESAILDIYGVLLLSFYGLSSVISQSSINLYITDETRKLIEHWLEQVDNDDHGRFNVGSDGKIWVEFSEDIQQKTKTIRAGINVVMENAEVLSPDLVDMPPELMSIHDSVDISVFSSMTLSHANDIPWLCIDPMFASLWYAANNKVINANNLLLAIAKNANFEDKIEGIYLHVANGMPRWVGFDELVDLSKSDDEYAPYFLAKLLEMYPSSYGNSLDTTMFVGFLLSNALLKTLNSSHPIWGGLHENNPLSNGYLEKLFYTVCRVVLASESEQKAEYKFTFLINGLIDTFGCSAAMRRLILTLATKFARGHFLDFDAINAHMKSFASSTEEA
ncbi:PIN domain-containing protein [Microbulbifer sp. TRSA001]|uniref:GapS6b family protein n=1 Tax=Microbulbifer sp. TRSA001 TaxID=3243381 RepID=UPI00403981A0